MHRNQRVFWSACVAVLGVLSATTGARAAGIVDVTPSSMGNWAFNNRDDLGNVGTNVTGGGAMVSGPASPPLGTGSANLFSGNGTIGGDGAGELRNTGFAGTLLSSITALSYSTYMTQNNGQQFPYFGLMINKDGTGSTADDILFFEPPYQQPGTGNPVLPDQGATALDTWQTWDALVGGWWDNDGNANPGTGVKSFASFQLLFPNAKIQNAAGTGLGGVRFDVGFASPGDKFNGNVDNFTIGIAGVNTTFNFDPDSVPEPTTLVLLGGSLLGLGLLRRRRNAA